MEFENQINIVEKKKKKGIIFIIILLILIIVGLVSYILIDKEIIFSKDNNQITEEKTNDKENIENKNNTNNNSNNTNSNSNDENNTEKETVKELDLSKSLNTKNMTYKNAIETTTGDYGISMNINSDKKSVSLSIDESKFKSHQVVSGTWTTDVVNFQIKGFSKNIKSTFIGEIGQDATGMTLFFLMEDGTVEYTPLYIKETDRQGNIYFVRNYTRDDFSTKGALANVSNVIKLYNADTTGARTTLAAKADGSFYDLGHELNK